MKYLGTTNNNNDIATKEYVDLHASGGGGASYDDTAIWEEINNIKESVAKKIEKIEVSTYATSIDFDIFTSAVGSPSHQTIPTAGETAGVITAEQAALLKSIVNPKLEVFSGSSSTSSPHVIESDTDIILTTNTSANAYLRLPPNAPNGKRILAKSLQGSTNRTITMYPSNDTDGKTVRLIGYSTITTSGASSVACSYYPVEFMCLIEGSTRYWLQISRY